MFFTLWASLSATTQQGGKADDTASSALLRRTVGDYSFILGRLEAAASLQRRIFDLDFCNIRVYFEATANNFLAHCISQ